MICQLKMDSRVKLARGLWNEMTQDCQALVVPAWPPRVDAKNVQTQVSLIPPEVTSALVKFPSHSTSNGGSKSLALPPPKNISLQAQKYFVVVRIFFPLRGELPKGLKAPRSLDPPLLPTGPETIYVATICAQSTLLSLTERVRQFLLFSPFGNPCELNCLDKMANSMRCDRKSLFWCFFSTLDQKLTKKHVMPH